MVLLCWSVQADPMMAAPSRILGPVDVNDQDPDPQPRYTQMNDNR